MSNWRLTDQMIEWRETKVRAAVEARFQKDGRAPLPYELDILAFNNRPFGDPWKYRFLLALYKHQWGDKFSIEAQGIENTWAIRMAKAFCREKSISLIGCASSTKTNNAARYGYTLWKCRPQNTTVHCSTTSSEAGDGRIWGDIKELFSTDKAWPVGKRIDSMQLITLDSEVKDEAGGSNRDFRNGVKYVKLKTGREGQNAVGTMCGRKNDFVVWLCDEENFMDIGVLDGRVNMYSNPFAQFIGIGNGPTEGTPLYIDAEPYGEKYPDGYRSIDIFKDEWWPTRTGVCLYFNGDKSPNMQAADPMKPPFPFMARKAQRDDQVRESRGEDTSIFWNQWYGFPPLVDVSDTVITHRLLEQCGAFAGAEWGFRTPVCVAGLDLGFREGGDPCVLDFAKVGPDPEDKSIICFEKDGIPIVPKQTDRTPYEAQVAKRVLDECKLRDCHDLALDISGDGGMSALAIKGEAAARGWQLHIVPISSLGAPDDQYTIPGETRKSSEIFDRKVTQLWMSFRSAVEKGLVRGMHQHGSATRQLCTRRFEKDERRRFSIERKKDMKLRLRRSPDFGDARVYCMLMAMQKVSVSPGKAVVGAKPIVRSTEPPKRYAGHGQTSRYTSR